MNREETHVNCVANDVRTRGPIHGCHVSLGDWLMVVVKLLGVRRVQPPDLPHCIVLTNSDQPLSCAMCLVMYINAYLFKFACCLKRTGVGPGLSPDPWSYT
jgi:hypothetical protein